jgi:hypothetical protein
VKARLRGVRARRHNCGAPAPVGKFKKLKLNVTEIIKIVPFFDFCGFVGGWAPAQERQRQVSGF